MTPEEFAFLEEVKNRSADPDMMQFIIQSAIAGSVAEQERQAKRAADMETVAAMALHTRLFKSNEKYIASILKRWNGKTSVKWDEAIAKLEGK